MSPPWPARVRRGRRGGRRRRAAFRGACSKVPPDLIAHWLDPIDQAAQSGDSSAMRDYVKLAIAEYDSVAAIVAGVNTAIARRDKARAYLQRAL